MPVQSRGQVSAPYVDIELGFRADRRELRLARLVAGAVAEHGCEERGYVEKVRLVVGTVAAALVPVAEPDSQIHCLFRVLDSEVRVRMTARACPAPTAESKSEHSRLLDQLLVSASTFTRPSPSGGFDLVSDAVVTLDD